MCCALREARGWSGELHHSCGGNSWKGLRSSRLLQGELQGRVNAPDALVVRLPAELLSQNSCCRWSLNVLFNSNCTHVLNLI